jgi:hypothetical protein
MQFIQNMLEKWLSSTTCIFFKKCLKTSKKSHAHLQCVHNNCARLEECQPKGVKELITQSRCRLFKTCWKNDKVQLHVNFSTNVRTLLKSHMHIFNVSITTVQDLKNVSLKVWEELITQSRYPIKDASPPGIYPSISHMHFMHFVQPGQKLMYFLTVTDFTPYRVYDCNKLFS